MQRNTVIFDMDGLLIDSEPLWQEAAVEVLEQFDVALTLEQYQQSMGLRSKEWLEFWFNHFLIDLKHVDSAGKEITVLGIDKIGQRGQMMPGVHEALEIFSSMDYKIGLATSSPAALIEVVVDKLQIRHYFSAFVSAQELTYGKPHPEVFLRCAEQLNSLPESCLCLEDSFNGMIAAKAARMKCIVIPDSSHYDHPQWGAADMKVRSLMELTRERVS